MSARVKDASTQRGPNVVDRVVSFFTRLWSSWNGLFTKLPRWVFAVEGNESAPETWKSIHDETSKTIRRVFHILVGTCLFCAITLGGTPDRQIVVPTAHVRLPGLNYPLGFPSFLVIAPAVLIGLTVYLHVFVIHQHRHPLDPDLRMPMLPNMASVSAKVITWLLFYWLVPVVLAFFTWKAWPHPVQGELLFWITIATAVALIWLQIRRCPRQWRGWAIPGIFVLLLCFSLGLHMLTGQRVLNLFGENLSGEDLRPMKVLDGAVLEEAKLVGSDLKGVSFQNARLSHADLTSAKAKRADFTEGNLSEANLSGADLEGATLRFSYLVGTDLTNSVLTIAEMANADLTSATLIDAKLRFAILNEATLTRADLTKAKLGKAKLQNANLEKANLTGADMTGASFLGAHLREATLARTVLKEAILVNADLRGVVLDGATLEGANLDGAKLHGVDLSRTKGLTQKQLDGACGDKATKVSAGLWITPCSDRPKQ